MKRIGILGDIGSGKSFVAKLFGLPVFNADEEVKKIYKYEKKCFKKLKRKFPNHITKYPIDKIQIIKIILDKKNNINKLGKVVHPFVTKNLKSFLKKNKNKSVVLDIPLLMENKILKKKLYLVFIDAKYSKIRKKLINRPGFNNKIYKIMKKNQLPLITKKKASDIIIKNNFKKREIIKQINKIKKVFNND